MTRGGKSSFFFTAIGGCGVPLATGCSACPSMPCPARKPRFGFSPPLQRRISPKYCKMPRKSSTRISSSSAAGGTFIASAGQPAQGLRSKVEEGCSPTNEGPRDSMMKCVQSTQTHARSMISPADPSASLFTGQPLLPNPSPSQEAIAC